MDHGPKPTLFLAAAGATGTAMHQLRHRRTVTGALLRILPIKHEYAAVVRGGIEHNLSHEVDIMRHHRRDEGARAAFE